MPQIPVIFIQMSLKTQILSFTDISQQCSYATGQAEIEFVGKEYGRDKKKKLQDNPLSFRVINSVYVGSDKAHALIWYLTLFRIIHYNLPF